MLPSAATTLLLATRRQKNLKEESVNFTKGRFIIYVSFILKINKMGPKAKVKIEDTSCNKKTESTTKPKVGNSNLFSSRTTSETSSSEEALDSSKYSNRKLKSNWQKYNNETDLPVEVPRSLNFSNFSGQRPLTSSDSYFRFSSEKNWEVLDKFDDYFKLNVNDLCREIMCLPLHERLKLNSSVLTLEQIETFTINATMYQSKFKEPLAPTKDITVKMLSLLFTNESELKEVASCKTGWSQPTEELTDKQTKTWDSNSENFFSLSGVEEELDLILSMPLPSSEVETSTQEGSKDDFMEELSVVPSNLELQNDWLDSLLDED